MPPKGVSVAEENVEARYFSYNDNEIVLDHVYRDLKMEEELALFDENEKDRNAQQQAEA